MRISSVVTRLLLLALRGGGERTGDSDALHLDSSSSLKNPSLVNTDSPPLRL